VGQDTVRSRSGRGQVAVMPLWIKYKKPSFQQEPYGEEKNNSHWKVRSRSAQLGPFSKESFVPCPESLNYYRHPRWQPKSQRRPENRRQLDLVAEILTHSFIHTPLFCFLFSQFLHNLLLNQTRASDILLVHTAPCSWPCLNMDYLSPKHVAW
jgi:hypothetical protein